MLFTKKLIRALSLSLAVLSALSFTACGKVPKSTEEERATVLTVDEYAVPYEQLRYFVRNYMNEYGDASFWTEERAAELSEKIFADTFESLRTEYAILSLAKRYGIERTDKAIEELVNGQIDAMIEEYPSVSDYVEDMAKNHLTDSVYRFLLTVTACSEELYYAMLEAGDIEPDDEAIEPIVRSDSFVRVKQILIANDPGEDKAKNRQKAEEALGRAIAGEDFDTLVKEYGEDLYMFNNTDGYYICRGVWYREFEDTAFSLGIGEISGIIETAAGYSILVRCEKEDAYMDSHMESLCDSYRDAQFSLSIEKKAAEMTIATNETFDSYTLLTID